jgi:hypothetical protein
MNLKVLAWVFAGCFLLGGLVLASSHRWGRGVLGAAARSFQPVRPTFPQGGYGIVLQRTGEVSPQDDLLYAAETAFDVVGIAAPAKVGSESPDFRTTCVQEPWLYDQTPSQTLDILARNGVVWRLQLKVVVDGRDESPRLERFVGRPIQLHAERYRFGVGTFATLRLNDEDGLVVALDFRSFRPGEDADVAIDTGATLYLGRDGCGNYETKTLELASDASLSLRPGQHATLSIHEQDYEAWNLASTMLTKDQHCTDMFSNVAWFVERHPDRRAPHLVSRRAPAPGA